MGRVGGVQAPLACYITRDISISRGAEAIAGARLGDGLLEARVPLTAFRW